MKKEAEANVSFDIDVNVDDCRNGNEGENEMEVEDEEKRKVRNIETIKNTQASKLRKKGNVLRFNEYGSFSNSKMMNSILLSQLRACESILFSSLCGLWYPNFFFFCK